ncbi:MAG: AAA family ATPase, partial [Pseudomonadota bacterium]|nr:AAA family ATPase [Pseudomonadota bacterium]
MKILRLEVCNLASLAANPEQPHVIDFTVSPLKDAGLLAITGATGAGKSTLLDAMCLALFNEVPRLRTAHLGQEGRLADVKDQLSFGDKRNVLSRGAAEGFARVEFQGLDGGRYRAEWRVKRAYLKADGALQAVERSLRDLDHNVVLASKAKECAERIEQLIGMNFDQFTRAVLLAQSEFSTFLKANDGERAALLECLTDSGIYTELGKLSFQKAKIAREAKQQLEAQHGLVTPLDDSARHQLEQQLITQTQACDHLTQQLKLLNEQQAWYQREAEIAQQRDLAQVAQHAAQADWQACRTPRQQVEQRQAVAEVRGDYLRAKSLHSEISLLMQQIADSQQQLGQAEYAVQQASVARQQADLAWQDWQQQLIQLKPRLAQAERDSVQLQHEQQEAQQEEVQFRAAKQAYDQQQIEQQQLQDRLVNQQRTQQHIDEQLFQSQAWATLDELPLAKLIELMQTTVTHHVARQQAQQQYAADQPAQQAAQQQFEQAQQALQ